MSMTVEQTARVHQPDPSAVDCENVLESLARLERLAIKLKERACRGSEECAAQLVALNDECYSLLAQAMEDHLRSEDGQ